MLVFLFILILAAALYEIYYFSEKLNAQKTQIMLLKRQNEKLKNKAPKDRGQQGTVSITYKDIDRHKGLIVTDCYLYLSPFEDSIILADLPKDTEVIVEDSAVALNSLWYEVRILGDKKTNTKGWVREKYLIPVIEDNFN